MKISQHQVSTIKDLPLQPPRSWKGPAEMEASEFPRASQGFMALAQDKHWLLLWQLLIAS